MSPTIDKGALRRRHAVNVFKAFHDVVYGYGVAEMAARMGQKPGTLYNKADASDDTHNQPTLRDVVLATQISGDMSIVDALNETFDRAAFDCSVHTGDSDEALLELLANLGAESGDFHRSLAQGLKARRFSPEVLEQVRAEAFDMVGALMVLVRRLEAFVDE